MPQVNNAIRSVKCPYTGEILTTVPVLRPDLAVIHAQRADRAGNVLVEGIIGIQKECTFAARTTIVTVEEVVADLRGLAPNAVIIPSWTVAAVVVAPRGASASYAHGFYDRSNAFYLEWDAISRDRQRFHEWMETHVLASPADHSL